MKIDRLEFSIAVTVAVSSAAMILFRSSALTVEVLVLFDMALLLVLMYFDWKKIRRTRKWATALFLSAGYWAICLGGLLTRPGRFDSYGWGALAVSWLVMAFLEPKDKTAQASLHDKPEQASTRSFEPISKSHVSASRQ